MQAAIPHVSPLMPAVYPKHQATLREELVCTFLPQKERPCSLRGSRSFRKRKLSGVDAEVGELSQETQELRKWVHKLSRPVTGSLCVPLAPRTPRAFED